MRNLTATAAPVDYRCFRRTAVNNERAAAPGDDVSEGQANQIHVLIEWFAIAESVGSGGCGALRQNDNETGEGNRHDESKIAPGNIGQSQSRQSARHSANHLDTVIAPIVPSTRYNHASYGHERTRKTRIKPRGSYDYNKDRQGNEDAAQVNLRRVLRNQIKLGKETMTSLRHAQHSVQLPDRNLKSDSGEETDQNSAGQKISQESCAQYPRCDQHRSRHERNEACHCDVLRSVGCERKQSQRRRHH